MKVIAALSAFPFVLLAVIVGLNASPDQADLAATALSILWFLVGTSFIFGLVFERSALCSVTVSGGVALLIMWTMLQFFASTTFMIRSALALALIILVQIALFLGGGVVRNSVAARLRWTE